VYTTSPNQRGTTSDLAANLTDRALEALVGTHVAGDSIETELRLWHALEAELERDRRWQRSDTRQGDFVPKEQVLRRVVCRAAYQVARATR
jgi:hypothetical protein